jgi:hypothetical protein
LKGRANHEENYPELLIGGRNYGRSLCGNSFRPAIAKEIQSAARLYWHLQRYEAL